jgi:tetratricopeptide (TPR) repeat protein
MHRSRSHTPRLITLHRIFSHLLIAAFFCIPLASTNAQTAQLPSNAVTQQLWAAASDAQSKQQYLQAASLYRKILDRQPDFVGAEVNLGLMLQLAGNLRDATATFEHVLRQHPDLFAPNLLAGLNYLKLDDPNRALPFLENAVKLQPDKIEARLGLANDNLQLRKYPEALEQFNRATQLDASDTEAWTGLGATYLSMEKDMESDLKRIPSPFHTILLAESYQQQGRTGKAVDALSSVIASVPDLPCVHSILGFANLQQSKFTEAAQQFNLDWNSQAGGCLLAKLGTVSLNAKLGKTQEALHELQEAAAIDPAFVKANSDIYLGDLSAAGVEDDVHQILSNRAENGPPTNSNLNPIAAMRAGRYSACSDALALRSQLDSQQLRTLALCSYYSNKDDRVLTATTMLLKRTSGDPEALYWRIQSVERLGMSALSRATEINPNSASLHTLMGNLLYEKGDLAEAAAEYRKAIDLKPAFLEAHIALARNLNADHKTDEAEQEIHSVLSTNPSDPEANYLMGEVLVNRSKFDEALPYLLNAQHAAPDELPYVHADLSRVYEERGQVDQAIAELKLATPVDVDGSYHYRLGHLYMRTGDRGSAAEALRIAENLRHQTDVNSLYQK